MRTFWRDVAFVVAGGAIGYNLQIASIIEGKSMLPTLEPGQKIFHLPYWAMGWWCWPVAVIYRIATSPNQQDRWRWGGHTNPIGGDIVLAHVDDKGTTVCKRVISTTTDLATITEEWEKERFRPDEEEEDILPEYSYFEEDSADEDQSGSQEVTIERSPGTAPLTPQLPRRSTEWDSCRHKGFDAMASGKLVRWLWLEGDNHSHSFDSRQVGAIPDVCLKGMALGVWWPINNVKIL